jgi:class 3 adenylate cyclase
MGRLWTRPLRAHAGSRSRSAVGAAVAAQRGLAAYGWPTGFPVRVRMGLHTGEGSLGGDNYVGLDVHRAARIAEAGHGGQVLVSAATRGLVAQALPQGVSLRDLGRRRLKDITLPEHLYDLVIQGLPADVGPPRTLGAGPRDLPLQLTSLTLSATWARRGTSASGPTTPGWPPSPGCSWASWPSSRAG